MSAEAAPVDVADDDHHHSDDGQSSQDEEDGDDDGEMIGLNGGREDRPHPNWSMA